MSGDNLLSGLHREKGGVEKPPNWSPGSHDNSTTGWEGGNDMT